MVTISHEVEFEFDAGEYWEEILDDMSVDEIEEYLEKRRKTSYDKLSYEEVKIALQGVAKIKLHPNLLCCRDEVKKAVNEVMSEIWI